MLCFVGRITSTQNARVIRTCETAKRVGAAYSLGRSAAAGCAQSLVSLLDALQADTRGERVASFALWGSDTQRAAMHGLSAGGDVAAEGLLPFLLDATVRPSVVGAAATALGEAAVNPTVQMVRAYQAVMQRLRSEVRSTGVPPDFTVAETRLQRHRGTAFCSAPFREAYTSPGADGKRCCYTAAPYDW